MAKDHFFSKSNTPTQAGGDTDKEAKNKPLKPDSSALLTEPGKDGEHDSTNSPTEFKLSFSEINRQLDRVYSTLSSTFTNYPSACWVDTLGRESEDRDPDYMIIPTSLGKNKHDFTLNSKLKLWVLPWLQSKTMVCYSELGMDILFDVNKLNFGDYDALTHKSVCKIFQTTSMTNTIPIRWMNGDTVKYFGELNFLPFHIDRNNNLVVHGNENPEIGLIAGFISSNNTYGIELWPISTPLGITNSTKNTKIKIFPSKRKINRRNNK